MWKMYVHVLGLCPQSPLTFTNTRQNESLLRPERGYSTRGLEKLAILYSLPYALFKMWG